MASHPITELYARLKHAGLTRRYVQDLLPFWWEDSLATDRIVYLHGLSSLVKHLGLPLAQMLDPEAELSPNITAPAAFKRRNNTDVSEFTWAKAVAISAAQHAVACLKYPYERPADSDPIAIRKSILRTGYSYVSLENLLDYCWSHGIPVLHLSSFPNTKMEGLAIYTDTGPAIVLTSGRKHHAWLLFHLAHELGHILCNHVTGEDYVDDESIDLRDEESQEAEANSFAVSLLTGQKETKFTSPRFIPPEYLGRAVKATGEEHGVDPGVVLLNYAFNEVSRTGNRAMWGVANKVLNSIAPDEDAAALIRRVMIERLDLSQIPSDSVDVLLKLSSIAT